MRSGKASMGEMFQRGSNGLSTIRLALASTVVLWHSFPLTGHDIHPEGLREVVGSFRVDAFFAISGFLILRTWNRRPDGKFFVRSRLMRVLPAFWVNLVVTALIVAPLVLWLADRDVGTLFRGDHSAWHYITQNASTWMFFFDIGGTPTDVPVDGAWNGSVWMLKWEMLCYAALLALGLLGLTRSRKLILSLCAAAWVAVLVVSVVGASPSSLFDEAIRFALMFLAGASLWAFADRIPSDWRLAVLSIVGIVAGIWMPDYRLTAAPALAYLVMWLAVHMTHQRWNRKRDYSYGIFLYGFPVQQSLMVLGWPYIHPIPFFLVSLALTVPLAALSWHLVEHPIANWKRRLDVADRARSRRRSSPSISYS